MRQNILTGSTVLDQAFFLQQHAYQFYYAFIIQLNRTFLDKKPLMYFTPQLRTNLSGLCSTIKTIGTQYRVTDMISAKVEV